MVLWERLAVRNGSRLAGFAHRFSPSDGFITAAILSLPLLLLAQIALLVLQLRFDRSPSSHWGLTLPIPVFDGDHGSSVHHAFFSFLGFVLGALETLCLGAVILAVSCGARVRPTLLAVAIAAFGTFGCIAPAMSTSDPYEYVATGMLGFGAYAPPPEAFAHTIYEAISRVVPLNGVIYGPLWVSIDTIQTSLGSTVAEKIIALRLWNVCSILALLQIMRASRLAQSVILAVILNPALWFYSVVNPHADILGLVFVATAFYFARRARGSLAVVALIGAGLIKFPLVIIGGVILSAIESRSRRLALWALAIVAVAALSYAIPNHAYAKDLVKFASSKAQGSAASGWIVVVPIIGLAMLMLVGFGKRAGGIALLFSQAGPIAAPWYLYWGVPYAIVAGSGEVYLAAIPLLATLRDETFELSSVVKLVLVVLLSALLFDQVRIRHVS